MTTVTSSYLPVWRFADNNNNPLSGGQLYSYLAGTSTPAACYTDSTGVTPLPNPIILNSRGETATSSGTSCGVWIPPSTGYKFVIQDSSGNTIWTIDNYLAPISTLNLNAIGQNVVPTPTNTYSLGTASNSWSNVFVGPNAAPVLNVATGNIGYFAQTAAELAASVTPTNYSYEPGNVLRYGADPTGATNSSTAISNACLANTTVYAPAGSYLCNVTVTKPVIFKGDGSLITLLKPNSTATAIITYNYQNGTGFWAYPSEFRDVSFYSTGQTGIGFTFGATLQSAYTAGMEYANNVKFHGCRFIGLNKGIQFPFGNIATEFYSCGFVSNYYGAYLLNNKQYPAVTGSTGMHAGNKYWFAGEFNNNTCAIYVNNTQGGFGAISLYGTILETNNIAAYIYSNAGDTTFVPIAFHDVWLEGNGAFVSASNVTIDSWAGSVVSTQSVAPHAYIFDGTGQTVMVKGGVFTDTNVLATYTRVQSDSSHIETQSGAGGYPFLCSGAYSQIINTSPITDRGVGAAQNTVVVGNFNTIRKAINTASTPASRVFLGSHRYNKLAGSYGVTATIVNLTVASNLANGSFPVTATTASDGIIYGTCNVWSIPFTAAGQIVSLTAGVVALTAGKWYVMTCNLKVVSGNTFNVSSWDRSGNVLFNGLNIPTVGDWYTVGAMGYSPNAVGTFYGLDFTSSSTTTSVIRGSAFQFVTFDNEMDAANFLSNNVYIGP